jgi:hypothetical protein
MQNLQLKHAVKTPDLRANKRITPENTLKMIKNMLKSDILADIQSKTPVAVFDLDGTLFNNFPRQIAIFNQVLKQEYPELQIYPDNAFDMDEQDQPYSLLALVQPKIESSDRMKEIKHNFLKFFLSNEFLAYDSPYPGSRNLIEFLLDMGFKIVYLTGRPFESMYGGTVASIKSAGLPTPNDPKYENRIQLFMKPDIRMEDFAYKEKVFENFKERADEKIVFFFDNEATACNLAQKAFPESKVIHFLSNQSDTTAFNGIEISNW